MARMYEEIKKLHAEDLFDDLKIVISLVFSRHANSSSSAGNCSIMTFTPFHIYQLNVFYADAWYASQDYARAERFYRDALGLRRAFGRPNEQSEKLTNVELTSEATVRYKLYKVYLELKQPKSAIHLLEALPLKDRTMGINMALGNLYRDEGRDRSAITSYKEVLRNCPLSVEATRNLISLGVQRLNIASQMLNTLQSINDEDWLIGWINLQHSMVTGDWPTSLSVLQKFEKVCSRNIDLLNIKADIHFMYGQYPQARILWQQVFDADPLMTKNADKLAYLLMERKDHAGLARLGTQLSSAGHSAPEPWVVNGVRSLLINKFNDAISLVDKALLIQPIFYTAHIVKGVALRRQNKSAESERCFRDALRYCPTRLEAYKESLKSSLRADNVKDAIATGNIALKCIGSTPSTLYMIGKALARGNPTQKVKAKMFLEKSVQIDPSFVHPVYILADLLFKQEKYKKVIHILENCLKDNSTSKLHQLMGDALCQVGDKPNGMHHYSLALHLDPSNKKAKEGMERAEKKSDLNSMDDSYVGDSLEQSSEMEVNEEGVDNLSWSDPELGY